MLIRLKRWSLVITVTQRPIEIKITAKVARWRRKSLNLNLNLNFIPFILLIHWFVRQGNIEG